MVIRCTKKNGDRIIAEKFPTLKFRGHEFVEVEYVGVLSTQAEIDVLIDALKDVKLTLPV